MKQRAPFVSSTGGAVGAVLASAAAAAGQAAGTAVACNGSGLPLGSLPAAHAAAARLDETYRLADSDDETLLLSAHAATADCQYGYDGTDDSAVMHGTSGGGSRWGSSVMEGGRKGMDALRSSERAGFACVSGFRPQAGRDSAAFLFHQQSLVDQKLL